MQEEIEKLVKLGSADAVDDGNPDN